MHCSSKAPDKPNEAQSRMQYSSKKLKESSTQTQANIQQCSNTTQAQLTPCSSIAQAKLTQYHT
eukprot:684594-Pyramimonas_sp.AAC.1